ncbi:hypothetical protein ACQEU6_24430 [Spirillospora sp. CA-108201]
MAVSRHDATLFTCGNSYTTSVDATRRRPRYQALNVLREFGPLAPTRFATTVTPSLSTDPSGEEPADDLPLSQDVPRSSR